MGLLVSTFGDNLRAELPACLPVLVDRMGNEITRLTAVKVGFCIYWPSLFQGSVFGLTFSFLDKKQRYLFHWTVNANDVQSF